MKKILHFLPDNQAWGGIEVYLESVLPQLRSGYEIVAAVTEGGQLQKKLAEAGIKVCPLPVHPQSRLMKPFDIRVLMTLLSILRQEKPDLVHIHKGRIEQAWIRLMGFPIVYTYHSYGGPNNLENAPNDLVRFIYACTRPLLYTLTPFLRGMLVVSDYERQRLYREGYIPKRFETEVLYNGLPTQRMLASVADVDRQAVRAELGIPQDARVVSFFCRLTPDKNAQAFLDIARRVINNPSRKNPVYFLVGGHGPMADLFRETFAQDPVLSQYGQYLGFRTDVLRLIRASDFTMSTSLQEGFGLRVLESILLGKPCITYAAGGIPEVMSLPDAQGWLIPSGNENRFVEVLTDIINLPDTALDALAPVLENHARTFDIQIHIGQLNDFYQRKLSQSSAQPGGAQYSAS